jgi:hypothetical protein
MPEGWKRDAVVPAGQMITSAFRPSLEETPRRLFGGIARRRGSCCAATRQRNATQKVIRAVRTVHATFNLHVMYMGFRFQGRDMLIIDGLARNVGDFSAFPGVFKWVFGSRCFVNRRDEVCQRFI